MTDNAPTPDEIIEAITPHTDQLNADDLIIGPITVTILAVRTGNREQPIVIDIDGDRRPYKPCKTMLRIIATTWTTDSGEWIGKQMTLFRDPDVVYAGNKRGGIRISHMSGIDSTRSFSVTESRIKTSQVAIKPIKSIATLTADETEYIKVVSGELASVSTLEELKGHGEMLKTKSRVVQDALRPVYAKRLKELKGLET